MKLPLFLCLILTSTSYCQNVAYPPYYRVSTDTVDDTNLKDEVGLFQKTEDNGDYNGHVSPVYKKDHNFARFLLRVKNGDWVISTEQDGNPFGLRQQSNYWHYPDGNIAWTNTNDQVILLQVQAVWPCEVQHATKYTYTSFQRPTVKNISECLKTCENSIGCLALTYYEYAGECFLFKNINTAIQEENAKSIKIDCDKEIKGEIGIPVQGKLSSQVITIISVCCGVLSLILLVLCAVFLAKRKQKSMSAARQETVDQNPDYGEYEEDSCVRPTQVVDRNDYYYEE
jgi:hypothetical protein